MKEIRDGIEQSLVEFSRHEGTRLALPAGTTQSGGGTCVLQYTLIHTMNTPICIIT